MSPPKTFQEAESVYERATKLEFAAEFSSAFHLYLEATDAFLHLSRSSVAAPAFQAQCKTRAAKAIQRAEKIKKASKTPGSQLGVVLAPINSFGADHQVYVLRKSSTVNNISYPLWSESVPLPSTPGARFSDPDGQPAIPPPEPTSSVEFTWKRPPRDLLSPQELSSTSNLIPADINQNTINDCSLCASVAVCIQHNRSFNTRLLLSSLLPGNQLGRCDLKVGEDDAFGSVMAHHRYVSVDRVATGWRILTSIFLHWFWVLSDTQCLLTHTVLRFLSWLTLQAIDDLLPFNDSGKPLGISSGLKGVAWPALIEKAYMKLMGGYDFPGSNSSIDLRVLTGWIPELVELQSSSFEREKTWERLANGFRKGNCMVTVGTDAKTTLKMEGVKLLSSHAYAVVDIQETKNDRWLTLIDSRVPASAKRLDGSNLSDTRTLNMRWDDICAAFEGIYASWDPALLPYGATFHGIWKPAGNDEVQASVRHLRLFYEFQNPPHGSSDPLDMSKDIWVLLTRHLSHTRREAEYIALSVHYEDEDEDRRDTRIKLGSLEVTGTFTTSPHVLVRTRVGRGFPQRSYTPSSASPSFTTTSSALLIQANYDGPFDDVCFTVNVFCGVDVKVRWDEDARLGSPISSGGGGFSMKVDGTLTSKNAGGNHAHPTYMLNPQWHLSIHDEGASSSGGGALASSGRASPLAVSVGGSSSKPGGASGKGKSAQKSAVVLSAQGPREVPLNVTAVWSSGERIVELAEKEVVTSSGAYTYGRARAAADMAPGSYTVILSAFEPQVHLGQFTLSIESSRQFDLTPIPQEGAGMYARVSKGEWDEHTAVGSPSHGRYHSNPIYEVLLPSNAQLCARLHLTSTRPTAALNLSLFPASSTEMPVLDRPLASSGPYSDALSGVSITTRALSPGRYWLVPSTFVAGVLASFRLVVYCSDAGCIVSRRDRSPAKP